MLISYAREAIKIIHLDYPTIAIAIITSDTKKVKLSVGIGQRTFSITEYDKHYEYTKYFFGEEVANRIGSICKAVIGGEICDKLMMQRLK